MLWTACPHWLDCSFFPPFFYITLCFFFSFSTPFLCRLHFARLH
ncbi:hypothetical protein, unlikely [Trypanosoma brucei brucei TREU927]|uniref:Uncharacterized protein n=1 Tax=Trypanosoma brucei brucei (strain 927/4 GUTat10.1) TaxID=185431 RepID=Q4GYB4_TRYB2|nr:hypothetical protein, unlikely [Trypanosoma brucei brucei TREU927]XP_024498413.1 hypothetical protein, unlikely [Trypanosoma brucei brucei TREU927]CAJ16667.1 hypothetical protein, unlikely [Trypanosoma brucei brucei TREU927]CAJ16670.1 hypothetical protein, unlikely [Trypanosoma brucei brucei TREU927]